MAFGLRGLATTIAHNTNPNRTTDLFIERVVHSDPLTADSKSVLREILRSRITVFTEEIDDLFSGKDEPETTDTSRIGVGVYYYEDDE